MISRPALPTGAALLLFLLAGCAGSGYPALPRPEVVDPASPLASHTLEARDAWLRHYLMAEEAAQAVALLQSPRSAPGDDLVRDLQLGLALRQAERWEESNAAFERAEVEVERRFSWSVSQGLGSLLVNDGVVSYTPPPTEQAMIPFYRMLNYLALGQADEARVEARKAVAYLERLRGAAGEPCVGEGLVQYLAGLTFAAAGDRADALVSLRQAERSYDGCAADGAVAPAALGGDLYRAARAVGVREVADSAAARYRLAPGAVDEGAGELLVVLELGWVAHRTGDALHVPIYDDDLDGLDSRDHDGILTASGRVGVRVLEGAVQRGQWGGAPADHPAVQLAAAAGGVHVMRLAWADFRREPASPPAVRVRVDDLQEEEGEVASDLSGLLVRHWERRRPAAMARTVARGMVRYLAAREAERRAERKHGEAAGWLVGRLGNLAGNRLERADTRSWSLLPDRVSLVRLSLPPGEHRLGLEVGGRQVELGTVQVRAGRLHTVTRRVWEVAEAPVGTLAGPAEGS